MLVATYNVNSIRARLNLLQEWLQRVDIDILCLQETKTLDDNFPKEELGRLGYQCTILGQKAYNGVAICSKKLPHKTINKFDDEILNEQKRLIGIAIDDIEIYSVYAPHGDARGMDKYHYKLRWYDAFIKFIGQRQGKVILAGDFNIAHKDMDVYDPVILNDVIGTMAEERAYLDRLIENGFIDTFRLIHPKEKKFSWWDYTAGAIWKDEGMRIDYIFCSKSFEGYLKDASIDIWPRKRRTPTPSDHTPVIASFVI